MSDSAKIKAYAQYVGNNTQTVGNALSGNWPGAIISGIGSLTNLFGGGSAKRAAQEQFNNQMALQQQAQQWAEYMYRNRYQMQREDLEAAGINPLFGMGSAPSTALGAGSAGMPEYVQEKQNKQQNILQGIQLGQEYSAKKAQIKNLEQQTKTEEWTTQLEALNTIGKHIENLQAKKELDNYDKKILKELRQMEASIAETISRTKLNNENTRYQRTAREGVEAQNQITKREAKWIKDHPMMSGFAIGAGKIVAPVSAGIGALAGTYAAFKTGKGNNYSAKRGARGANKM